MIHLVAANASHAEAIALIHNDAVLNSTAIWYDTAVSVENRAQFIKARQDAGFAFLVAQDALGQLLGYASYGEFRAFSGYRHTVEHLVYVDKRAQGRGVATALLTELIAHAKAKGMHAMVGAIESGNQASLKLHQKMGFVEVGRMPEVGTKFGRWLDLTWVQKLI